MKALALTSPGTVNVIETEIPTFGSNELLIKMLGVGICGSDLSVFEGHRKVPSYPWIMGHEGVGEIAGIGADVKGRVIGEKVVIEPNYCCFNCPPCRAGVTSGCLNRVIVGMEVPGLLSEYAVVPDAFAWKAPDYLSLEELVCLEPLTVGVAAMRRTNTELDHRCLVIGAGSTGLMLINLLSIKGIEVSFVEPHAQRSELAESIGAHKHFPGSSESFDRIFETSGTAVGFETAISLSAPGAKIAVIGLGTEPANVISTDIVRRRLSIVGSMIYDHPQDFSSTISDAPKGLSRIIQGKYTLSEAQKAFESAPLVPGKSWFSLSDLGE